MVTVFCEEKIRIILASLCNKYLIVRFDIIPPDDLQIIDFGGRFLRKNHIDEPLAHAVIARLSADHYVQLTTCIGYYAILAMTVNTVELELNPKPDTRNLEAEQAH